MIALTFDDAATTNSGILSVLQQENVDATYFMVGWKVDSYPAQAQLIGSAVMLIGNHTYNHPHLWNASADQTLSAKASDYSTYTRYSASLTLPSTGKWRIRASHEDAEHAATYSNYKSFTLK